MAAHAQLRHATDHLLQHIARAGHHEVDARVDLMDLVCRLDEVLRSFLVGDSAEEGHHLGIQATALVLRLGLVVRLDGVVHRNDLVRVDAIFLNDDVARQIAHRDHAVGGFHATSLDGVNIRVDVLARAVELGGVHVHHKRLARGLLGRNACRIGQPVVGVDDVEVVFRGQRRANQGITRHFLHQVHAVFARKLVVARKHRAAAVEVLHHMTVVFQHVGELLRPDIRDDVGPDFHVLYTLPITSVGLMVDVDGHVAGVEQTDVAFVLVAIGTRHHKQHLNTVLRQTFGHAVASRSEAACDMRGELPPKHQDSHFEPPFLFNSSIKYLR